MAGRRRSAQERRAATEVGDAREVVESHGGLVLVGTPIGNLGDMTQRAKDALASADIVVAEDTRRTRVLLSALGISARVMSMPAYLEAGVAQAIAARVERGERVALCSDAGMPGVCDPGREVVRATYAIGGTCEVAPGVSAVTTALALTGAVADQFHFLGFLPRQRSKMRAHLEAVVTLPGSIVFFDSPRRIHATILALADLLSGRLVHAVFEMTKLHEEVLSGTADEVAARLALRPEKGECTVVIDVIGTAPPTAVATSEAPS